MSPIVTMASTRFTKERATKAKQSPLELLVVQCLAIFFTWNLSIMSSTYWSSSVSSIKLTDGSNRAPLPTATAWAVETIDRHTINKEEQGYHPIIDWSVPSRVWSKFEGEFPCYRGQTRLMFTRPTDKGFLFHRPMKVGSTTMVSVVLRLAHNRSPWLKGRPNGTKCIHRSMHGSALSMKYDKRIRSKSFLFSLVRDPTKRAISEFFHFFSSINKVEPTDRNFLQYLSMPHLEHNYLYDLQIKNYTTNTTNSTQSFLLMNNMTNETELSNRMDGKNRAAFQLKRRYNEFVRFGHISLKQVVQDILDGYDFIAVTERMDESLVVMQMLLNLTTNDILYTRARSSGTFSNGPPGQPCLYIRPSFLTPRMKKYLGPSSPEWQETIRGDLLLYKAVHASLDRTIEALGKEQFQQNLNALRTGLVRAQEHCKGRVRTQCSEGGDPIPYGNRTCYIWGEACDHECLDELAMSDERL